MKKLLVLTYPAMEAMLIATTMKMHALLFITLIMCVCRVEHEIHLNGICFSHLFQETHSISFFIN